MFMSFKLGLSVLAMAITFFSCVNGMRSETTDLGAQEFMEKYKRDYPSTNMDSLDAGLYLLISGNLNLLQERALADDLVQQAAKLHESDPSAVEKLVWRYHSQLMPSVKELFEKWARGPRRRYHYKITAACFILGTIIFSCTNFVMQLLTHPESIEQLGYCDVTGHDGLFPVCFTKNDTI